MKKIVFLIIVIFHLNASIIIALTTIPGGSVSGIWTLAGSPYNVIGSIQIPNDSTLTIQPGVAVYFQGAYKLDVQGRLLANGTLTDTIIFTAANISIGWKGIRFATDDTSKFMFCKIQYSKTPIYESGGALNFSGFSNGIISNCLISDCFSGDTGGGISCGYYNNIIISNNIISNNESYSHGGGIYGGCGYGSLTISNNIITNNSASGVSNASGGGIYITQGNPDIMNNVIANNSAAIGGGLCFASDSPTIYNTILWGNTASIIGSQVSLTSESCDPNFYFCDVEDGFAAFDINGNIYSGIYQNNINTDPLFVAPSGGSGLAYNGFSADWSLQNSSPCIDKGDPNGTYPSADIAGNPRVTVCRIDIGAYEYQTGIPLDISLSISQPILCNGAATGGIAASASGGSSPYTYLWSSGQTAENITGLVAGNYSVTVSTPSYGCSITKSITIMEPGKISADAGADKSIICGGTAQLDYVTSNYTGTGTLTYNWSPSIGLNSDTIPNPTATIIQNIKYFVTISTLDGCTALDSVNVSVNPLTANAGSSKTVICGGTTILDSITTNYTGTGVLTYNWYPVTGLNYDTIPNPFATVTSDTKYFINVTTTNGCYAIDSVNVITNALTANAGTGKTIVCGGTTLLDSVTSNYTGTGTLTYNWSPSTGLNSDTISNPTATVTSETEYYVTIETPNGCIAIDSLIVFMDSLTITATDNIISCGDSTILNTITNYTGTDTLTYSWLPTMGLNTSIIANPLASVESDQTYSVTVTTHNGCTATDNINITLIPMNVIDICIVGVDSANKNMIAWNKPTSTSIDSFCIYRETNITNIYQKIGTTSYDSLSVFVDANSYPNVQSNKYKLSIKDNCGLESMASDPHKTMHLSINQGQGTTWNLIWDPYEGFIVSTYNIFRGTAPDSMQLIGTSSGSNTQYSDLSAPSGFVYYQVEVVSPNQCNPTRSYNSSRSNIASNNVIGIFENNNLPDLISISPNPASDIVTLSIDYRNNTDLKLNIYNVIGDLVKSEMLKKNQRQINIENLSNGIYIIEIKSEGWKEKQKLIIQK